MTAQSSSVQAQSCKAALEEDRYLSFRFNLESRWRSCCEGTFMFIHLCGYLEAIRVFIREFPEHSEIYDELVFLYNLTHVLDMVYLGIPFEKS